MSDTNYVVKISTALSNHPLFVRISDPTMSVDRIFAEAIETLKNTGKPLESQQLAQLFKEHQIFNNGKVQMKGTLFSELEKKAQTVGDKSVQVAELDLVSSHHGGSEDDTIYKKLFFKLLAYVFDNTVKRLDQEKLSPEQKKDRLLLMQSEFIRDLELASMDPIQFRDRMSLATFHITMFGG